MICSSSDPKYGNPDYPVKLDIQYAYPLQSWNVGATDRSGLGLAIAYTVGRDVGN